MPACQSAEGGQWGGSVSAIPLARGRQNRKIFVSLIEKNFGGARLKKCKENFSVLLAEAKWRRAETLGGFCARQGADCRLKKVRAFSNNGHHSSLCELRMMQPQQPRWLFFCLKNAIFITRHMEEQNEKNRMISGISQNGDRVLDLTLRPQQMDEFIGQNKIKESLDIFMQAAKQRQEPNEHVLLYGPPGLGKTTLAHIIANNMGTGIKITSGPAIEKAGDLAAILTNLEEGDILFIDEIHRLNKLIEEVLYPAMEDYALDIVIGKGPSARTLRLDLPKFTILGATTRYHLLSSPLRDRFGATYHLDYYQPDDIQKIIKRSASILKIDVDQESAELISHCSRLTPRVANRLLKRVRDYAQVKADGRINKDITDKALDMLAIDKVGLDYIDRRILEVIIDKFKGGPVGVTSIAAATSEDVGTVEEIYEPYLMQLGLIMRTPRGRVVTEQGYQHLDRKVPDDLQQKLI